MFLKHKPRGFLEAVLAGTMIRKLSATSRAGTIREHNNQGKTVQHAECESGSFGCTLEHGKNKERDRDPQNWVGALPATSRHTRRLLWLLPSGSDLVNRVALRENQQSPH